MMNNIINKDMTQIERTNKLRLLAQELTNLLPDDLFISLCYELDLVEYFTNVNISDMDQIELTDYIFTSIELYVYAVDLLEANRILSASNNINISSNTLEVPSLSNRINNITNLTHELFTQVS